GALGPSDKAYGMVRYRAVSRITEGDPKRRGLDRPAAAWHCGACARKVATQRGRLREAAANTSEQCLTPLRTPPPPIQSLRGHRCSAAAQVCPPRAGLCPDEFRCGSKDLGQACCVGANAIL